MELFIERINSAGQGIARSPSGKTAFVQGALPGEKVLAAVRQEKKSYIQGRVERVLEPSEHRRTAPCRWNRSCGGCQLQHCGYSHQLELKSQIVADALRRIGGFRLEREVPCEPSDREWEYRNKASFPVRLFRGRPQVGFFKEGSHDLVPLDRCMILCSRANDLYGLLRTMIQEGQFSCYDEQTGRGWLRHLVIRSAQGGRYLLLMLVVTSRPGRQAMESLRELWRYLKEPFPELQGLTLNLNSAPGNGILGKETITVAGQDRLTEQLDRFQLTYDSTSFFQANPGQAEKLFSYAASLAQGQSVLELYCGVGAMTVFLARQCRQVQALELWEPAVALAEENLRRNGYAVPVLQGDAERGLTEESLRGVDWLVVDPPRGGCSARLLEQLGPSSLKGLLYVSCNPATLARDMALLAGQGFAPRWETLKAFDLFPQTSHVETAVLLTRDFF